ncbi:MAG: type VI secretion system protein ImpE [Pirellulaceae bacterium]|jgi:type VI secretion system protein ImpE
MEALEQFNLGDIEAAVSSAIALVKAKPSSIPARLVLAQMLCFQGDLERADKHLETALIQAPEQGLQIALYRQLLRAEISRKECLSEGRLPEFVGEASDIAKLHIEAMIDIREGRSAEAAEKLAQVEEKRPHVTGTCDEKEFTDIRDQDDLTSSFMEVLTSTGKYYWVPFEKLQIVDFEAPKGPWDLLWRQADMVVTDGPTGVVYVPITYYPFDSELTTEHRLGRTTDWIESDGVARGIGRREFWLDEDAKSIMEISSLRFDD